MRIALVLVLLATPASAHIALTSPSPRTVEQKTGPCGAAGSTRTSNVAMYAPGETITVEWNETVDHPGHFRISFDDDGNDFTNPSRATDNFPQTLMEPIADKVGGHYTAQVTLPTTPCANCTLQLMQVMTTTEPYNSFYWQCADIQIGDGMQPPGDDSGGGCSTSRGAGLLVGLALIAFLRRRR